MSKIITGHCVEVLKKLPSRSVHMVCTSPPYWGLRDYGTEPVIWSDTPGCDHAWTPVDPPRYRTTGDAPNSPQQNSAACYDARKFELCTKCGAWRGELGMEPTPCMYIKHLGEVFAEVWRVLRPDGTFWLNLGASYTARAAVNDTLHIGGLAVPIVFRAKDLIPIPWLAALTLQQQGWFFRSDIIWNKPAATTESVDDRPSCTHEYISLFSRDSRYYFDYVAIMQDSKTPGAKGRLAKGTALARARGDKEIEVGAKSRKRDVWTISTSSFKGAHFACVDADTECLTADGWKRYDEIKIGDLAAQYNIETQQLSWAPIRNVATYAVENQDMVVARYRNTRMMLTPNHRCVVQRRAPRGQYGLQLPTIVEAANLKPSHRIPVAAQWSYAGDEAISLDWAELLGWYIAEGHADNNRQSVEIYQSVSANPEQTARIETLLQAVDIRYNKAVATRMYRERPTTIAAFRITGYGAVKLRELAPQKQIPAAALLWSNDRILALLTGLVRGDGHIRTDDGRWCFVQKSQRECGLVQALAIRLGWCACVSSRRLGNGVFVTHITTNRTTRSLRGTNSKRGPLPTEKYTGTVWCPQLPDGTWVARREGRAFITGNTYPPLLVEPMILAGTSEKGCCPICGAPWLRQTKKVRVPTRPGLDNKATGMSTLEAGKGDPLRHITSVETVGWNPSCQCPANKDPIPCTVLDPFSGAATTGLVAGRLGRNFIGIDINPKYNQIALDRLRADKETKK